MKFELTGKCKDCGADSYVLDLHAYGPNKPAEQCDVCYMADNRRDDLRIATAVCGIDAQVVVLLDTARCDNCGLRLSVPGAIRDNEVDCK